MSQAAARRLAWSLWSTGIVFSVLLAFPPLRSGSA
jgi:hypothetical protein